MALWPNSTSTRSANGLLKLPANSRATAYLSVGNWTQNDALIPFTINTALAQPIPLDRPTADASARVTAMTYSVHVAAGESAVAERAVPLLRLRQPHAAVPRRQYGRLRHDRGRVRGRRDEPVRVHAPHRSMLDASFTPIRSRRVPRRLYAGAVDQTFRTFRHDDREHRAAVGRRHRRSRWLTLRGVYEHAQRVGSGLDEQALDDIGEQISLRQFDISDRTSNRVSAIVFR